MIEKPSAQRRAPSDLLSKRHLVDPLNLTTRVLVERLTHHCRIVWHRVMKKSVGNWVGVDMMGKLLKRGRLPENSLPFAELKAAIKTFKTFF